jgi:hypothetical protein
MLHYSLISNTTLFTRFCSTRSSCSARRRPKVFTTQTRFTSSPQRLDVGNRNVVLQRASRRFSAFALLFSWMCCQASRQPRSCDCLRRNGAPAFPRLRGASPDTPRPSLRPCQSKLRLSLGKTTREDIKHGKYVRLPSTSKCLNLRRWKDAIKWAAVDGRSAPAVGWAAYSQRRTEDL